MHRKRVVYSFITRHFATSPLSDLASTHHDAEAARNMIGRLVPFLTEKRSTVKFETMSAAVTDIWSRFEPVRLSHSLTNCVLNATLY